MKSWWILQRRWRRSTLPHVSYISFRRSFQTQQRLRSRKYKLLQVQSKHYFAGIIASIFGFQENIWKFDETGWGSGFPNHASKTREIYFWLLTSSSNSLFICFHSWTGLKGKLCFLYFKSPIYRLQYNVHELYFTEPFKNNRLFPSLFVQSVLFTFSF